MTLRWQAIAGALVIVFLFVAAPAGASDVRVEGTTDTTDSGLIQDIIQPGFQAAYPQYTLKYHATGTGAALTNARAGQADAVLTHAPPTEAQFVQDGFSFEPFGRATFYNDYVLIGHDADPANVLGADPHDAIGAMEAIAAAGAAGNATWISRGDQSGTHVQEGLMWCMTSGVALHSLGAGRCEPDNGSGGTPGWYKKTGVGQAGTVQVTAQCNFPPASANSCYSMTDRGTYDNLQSQGAIAGVKVVSEKNDANARGGETLLINPFHAYVVNPTNPAFAGKNLNFTTDGATAFLDYLTSPQLQQQLLSYPSTANPRFFTDATPQVQVKALPKAIDATNKLTVKATLVNKLPGAGPVQGAPASLQFSAGISGTPFGPISPNFGNLDTDTSDGSGNLSLSARPPRTGQLQLAVPQFQDLTATNADLGATRVTAAPTLSLHRDGTRLKLSGKLTPAVIGKDATIQVLGRQPGAKRYRPLTTQKLRNKAKKYSLTTTPGAGQWKLKTRYRNPGIVLPGDSNVRSTSA